MSAILSAWIGGIALGLGVAMPLGPVNLEIIRRHLGQGFAAGLLLGLGACTVDTAYIVLISFGLITARPGPRLQAGLLLAASLVLLLLAGMILRSAADSARQAARAGDPAGGRYRPTPTARWRHYAVGLAMTAVNPLNIVFCFGVIVTGASGAKTPLDPWPAVVGVMCGTVAWVTGLNLVLVPGRRLLRPKLVVAVNIVSAAVLAGMAGRNLWALFLQRQ